ncbi:MAG: 2,3,4,5-tetrahydropyridine-2,6-dicarboxylate N-succinyltransferase [Pseudohongiella sp.]|nr:MAG: 2,3,4,5-tetrahydropyridine-2,6-dicarboxylate N-succinyltransferase [Pseudohongiella sp.]
MTNSSYHSLALGLATRNSKADIIEVFYPEPVLHPSAELVDLAATVTSQENIARCGVSEISQEQLRSLAETAATEQTESLIKLAARLLDAGRDAVLCHLPEDAPPNTVAEAFLKLHLLSHRLVKPHGINLEGIFGVLVNNAWTNVGAIDLRDLPQRQLQARLDGTPLSIASVDKFPKITDYVAPSGVRIAHTARVRLGAYLGEGTTVMHEGFVNFNAGTEGPAMIEGRISAGVMVGANSDLGGGCSTMGTLSGGGKEIISVGKNCLIGANAGIGFPLADGCIVEAGLYVTAGTKVNVLDDEGRQLEAVKAKDVSTTPNRLFRRNSLTGAVECVPLRSRIELNEALHSND